MPNPDQIDPANLRLMRTYPMIFGPWPRDRTLPGRGIACGPGWLPLLTRLCADLSEIIREDRLTTFRAQQVKEKLGGLRFYATGGNPRTAARIERTEAEAAFTCETCGARPSPIRSQRGWLTTSCDTCLEKLRQSR